MARFKGLMLYQSDLKTTDIIPGQMILCPDSQELFADVPEFNRVQITDIVWVNTNTERLALNPVPYKIYIVKETCHLWSYVNNEWCDLTNSEDVSEEIEEGDHLPISADAVYKALLLKADVNSPTLTGEPKTTTAAKADNSTRIASTAFVKLVLADYVTKAGSPNFTVTPTAPTATKGDNSTKLATTQFVQTELNDLRSGKADRTIGREITLAVSKWSNYTQTANVTGVLANSLVTVGAIPADLEKYSVYGIRCVSQANGTLTFNCDITPKEDVKVNVFIFS